MIDREVISVPAIETFGPYSQAVRAGEFLFVSGQLGVDPVTGKAAGPAFEMQALQALHNLGTVLRSGSSSYDLVVNITVLLSDLANFADFNRLFEEFFPKHPPARLTFQVPLPNGLLIAISCVAVTKNKT